MPYLKFYPTLAQMGIFLIEKITGASFSFWKVSPAHKTVRRIPKA